MKSSWIPIFIGLGSNLDDPEQQLRRAVASLSTDQSFRDVSVSLVYRSEPLTLAGSDRQPSYLNAVLAADTVLTAPKLLKRLKKQEKKQGRKRTERWGARPLDLDILLYDDEEIDEPGLKVPHYAMSSRLFVLQPLADLQPELSVPGLGRLSKLLAGLSEESALERTDIGLL